MPSAIALNGEGVSRCYPFWYDFVKCMYVHENHQERVENCTAFNHDYYECMHGFKAKRRQADLYRVEQAKRNGTWDPVHYRSRMRPEFLGTPYHHPPAEEE
ncbi:hypothetical protein NDN08_003863 [Rhodosorus marinus]|uniref:NADH dehydrogenase [ubiquinone] iron-sulfur protein 5 n=1 Tax=Rhodosorus marinus TaxID=101924 RepID=A0AAV8UGN3_9RHOD|nr:hypothetical protein NDN08_003863 [Rhodosorus marinus]